MAAASGTFREIVLSAAAASPFAPPDAFYADLFDVLPAGVAVCDERGHIVAANPFFRDLVGGGASPTAGVRVDQTDLPWHLQISTCGG